MPLKTYQNSASRFWIERANNQLGSEGRYQPGGSFSAQHWSPGGSAANQYER